MNGMKKSNGTVTYVKYISLDEHKVKQYQT